MGGFNSKSKRKTSFRTKTEELMPRPKSEERISREVLTEKILLHISKKIGAEWRLLCVSLGVSRPEIDHINYDTTFHGQTKVYKGLLCWLRLREDAAESELTEELWEALIEKGRQDLVDHIEDYLKEMETTAKGSEIKDDIKIGTEDDEGSTVLYSITTEDSSVLHKQDEDSEVKELRERLIKINCKQTQNIPVSPLQKTSTVLLEEIFAPVSIREDLEYHGQDRNIGTKEDRRTKPVNHPNEMLYVDGDMAQNIFMLGNAGIGKSVYCLKLVENWCKAKGKTVEDENLNSWVEAMKNFDFLFFAQLRHVNKSRTSVSDMICNDLFKHHPECNDVIRRVISDVRYRCLIIMDGLDEWKISDEAKQKLTVQGLPNTEGMANCTFLWSMRHWVMDKFSNLILSNDRVIELQGLDTYSINTVIKNLLANIYKLDEKSPQYKEKFKEITEKSRVRDSKLKSIIQMPLMAIACVQIWYEENDVGNSMTSLFVALLDLLIKRSNSKSPLPSNTQEKLVSEPSEIHVTHYPNQFMKKKRVNEIMSVIIKLGKIAYDDLMRLI